MCTLTHGRMGESQMPGQEPEVESSLLVTQGAEIRWYLETLLCSLHYEV